MTWRVPKMCISSRLFIFIGLGLMASDIKNLNCWLFNCKKFRCIDNQNSNVYNDFRAILGGIPNASK